MTSYQKVKAENERLKKQMSEAQKDILELIENPNSVKSILIRKHMKMRSEIEKAVWFGSVNNNHATFNGINL